LDSHLAIAIPFKGISSLCCAQAPCQMFNYSMLWTEACRLHQHRIWIQDLCMLCVAHSVLLFMVKGEGKEEKVADSISSANKTNICRKKKCIACHKSQEMKKIYIAWGEIIILNKLRHCGSMTHGILNGQGKVKLFLKYNQKVKRKKKDAETYREWKAIWLAGEV